MHGLGVQLTPSLNPVNETIIATIINSNKCAQCALYQHNVP
jgi:hypothetical protein